jgi:hypothetical protein
VSVPTRSTDAERVRSLARVLDTALRIPGTGIRFGLDSILGLIPGIGDVTGAALSGYIVLAAARTGVPASVLARMILNLGVDTLVGSIPLLGDLFDVGFRANVRNAALLEKFVAEPVAAKRSSRVAVGLALGAVVLLAIGGIALTVLAVRGLNWLATQ